MRQQSITALFNRCARCNLEVHQIMREVHHYEGASQTCRTKQILITKLFVSKNEPFNQPMTFRI